MIRISTDEAMRLLGVKRRRFFQLAKAGTIQTRIGTKSRRGKPHREVLLESLPQSAQRKYFESLSAGGAGEERSDSAPAGDAIESAPVDAKPAASPLATLPEKDLAELNRRADLLRTIEGADGKAAAKLAVAEEFHCSVSKVEKQLARLKSYGLAGLLRKTRSDAGESRALPSNWTSIAAGLFLKKQTPNFMKAHRDLERECILQGIEPPSYSWTVQWIKRALKPSTIAFKRSTKKYREDWRVKYEPCVLREKHDQIRDIADGDWHLCDIFIVDDEGVNGGKPYRPFLCAVGDCCSDEIFGMHLQPMNGAIGIGLALRHAFLPKRHPVTGEIDDKVPRACAGVFKEFFSDKGKDFTSEYIGTVMRELGGMTRVAEGFHGQSKPIERWFNSLAGDLISELPGYCGGNPQRRPHDYKPTLTRRELFAKIYEWTFYEYHNRATRALRNLSPYAVLTSHVERGFKPVIPDSKMLDFLLMPGRWAVVRKWGIEMFGTSDRRNIYQDDALVGSQLIGERVLCKYDPDDIATLYVYHNKQFIGSVHQERRRGYKERDLRDLYRRRKIARRADQDRIKELMARAQYPDDLERVKAERRLAEMEDEELRSTAAGASSGSVSMVIPQYKRAAKLSVVQSSKGKVSKRGAVRRADETAADEKPERNPWLEIDNLKTCGGCGKQFERTAVALANCCTLSLCPDCLVNHRHERNPWLDEEPLPTSEELFKREDNPWLGDHPTECDQCGEWFNIGDLRTRDCCFSLHCGKCAEAHICERDSRDDHGALALTEMSTEVVAAGPARSEVNPFKKRIGICACDASREVRLFQCHLCSAALSCWKCFSNHNC